MEEQRFGADIYGAALQGLRAARGWPDPGSAGAKSILEGHAVELARALEADEKGMLLWATRSTAGHYLDAHSVNVAILAMHVGRGAGASAEIIPQLGAAAMFHDLARLRDEGQKASSAAAESSLHPAKSEKLFDHQQVLEAVIPDGLREIVPVRLSEDEEEHVGKRRPPHHGAQIIAMCDLYESMTHVRAWREPQSPHDALLSLMRLHRRASDQPLMKSFAERLSLFPLGSYVGLSNGQYGRVCEVFPSSPTRPDVRVFAAVDGQPIAPYVANLRGSSHLSIDRVFAGQTLPVMDVRQRLRIAASAWWPPANP